jgi:hypothetical protein
MTDTNVALLRPSSAKGEGRPKVKDPTGPLRSRRGSAETQGRNRGQNEGGERFRSACKFGRLLSAACMAASVVVLRLEIGMR